MSIRPTLLFQLLAIAFASWTTTATAACPHCGGDGVCETATTVTVMETQTVCETLYRDEEQVRVKLVPKVIQVEKQVPYEYTAWVRVKKEDVQTFEVKTPKFRWVDQKYTVDVPGKDTVTKFHTRTENVPVTKIETVTEDQGHYESKMVASDTCDGCLCTEKKVWCPHLVEVPRETTTMECVTVKEPYVCEVPIVVPIEKTRRVKEYFTKIETKTIKHPYTTLEPRKRTKMVTAIIPETVMEEQFETCFVKVPYTVTREVEVPVTRQITASQPCPCQKH